MQFLDDLDAFKRIEAHYVHPMLINASNRIKNAIQTYYGRFCHTDKIRCVYGLFASRKLYLAFIFDDF